MMKVLFVVACSAFGHSWLLSLKLLTVGVAFFIIIIISCIMKIAEFCWVPAHVGIMSLAMSKADKLAKKVP